MNNGDPVLEQACDELQAEVEGLKAQRHENENSILYWGRQAERLNNMLHAVRQAISSIKPDSDPIEIRNHLAHLTSEEI